VWFGVEHLGSSKLGLDGGVRWVFWALSFPTAIMVAAVFERFVDAPLQRWIKPRLERGSAKTKVGAPITA
jgi:peptidoglycan/LPS O-acetylase OafA/YrhL